MLKSNLFTFSFFQAKIVPLLRCERRKEDRSQYVATLIKPQLSKGKNWTANLLTFLFVNGYLFHLFTKCIELVGPAALILRPRRHVIKETSINLKAENFIPYCR